MKELAVPISLKGPLDNPRVSIDLKAFADNLAKAGAGELSNKLKSELAGKSEALKKEAATAADRAVDKAKAGDVKGLESDAKGLPADLKKATGSVKDLNPSARRRSTRRTRRSPPK